MNSIRQIIVKSFPLAISIAFMASPSTASAQSSTDFVGDATAGEKVFKKCKACHKVGDGAKNSTGPVLNNVIGRAAGSYEGYKYGKGMRAAGVKGLVWDEKQIFNYILDPKKYLRAYLGDRKAKAKMRFKLKKEDDRRNVIAYLLSIANTTDGKAGMKRQEQQSSAEANAALASHDAEENEICIQNNFPKELLLAVEAKSGQRQIKTVGQSGILCIRAGEDGTGTVGVFESEDALEGCSRLAKAGKTEVLIAYASFDNCAWKD